MKAYIKLLRLHHAIKNLFVFSPFFFAFKYNEYALYPVVALAFILFTCAESSMYILNDIMDVNEDRSHPEKAKRPIASGAVPQKNALLLMGGLVFITLAGSYFLSYDLFLVLVIYLVLNTAYSFGLKHITILDIFIIASGFVLRIFAGSVVIFVPVTMWIILMTFLLALFLALAKRRADVLLAAQGLQTRKNIDGYNLEFVNSGMIIMAAVVVVSYIFYTISADVTARFGNYLYTTVVFVILGILRYMQITFVENESGDPVRIVIKDHFLKITIVAWIASFYIIVHLFKNL